MEKMNKKMKKITKLATVLFIAVLILIIVVLLILKYQVEGEKNMPFKLGKIMIISTAEGIHKDETEATWDLDVVQNNDVYIEIDKNKNYKDTEIIDKIVLDNLKVISPMKVGELVIYRPTTNENKAYEYIDEFIIKDKLEYVGSKQTNIKNMEVANQGGMLLFRYCIKNIGEYSSNEDTEIQHDGTLLAKAGITLEQIECEVAFDITITLKSGIGYKGTVHLKLPVGNLIDEGTSSIEITDFSNVVFKRI